MARITAGKILKVAVLPGIIPRTRHLLSGGFGHISFYMAQLFHAVRLLPSGHPYLSPANFGRFGISHVTAESWRMIVQGQRQIDQVLIFGIVILGIGILFVQFCFLGVMLFVQTANALPANGFLNTLNPTTDLAFILMDSVFGIPADSGGVNFFGSCVAQAIECFTDNPYPHPAASYPMPYHEGLHTMLMVYSIGLLVIAAIIFSYFAVTVLLETAESGTPFGKRFDHVWAPIRMVMAIALLIPIASGLNAAQYLVLYAAKWGSGFATTGWELFIDQSTGTPAALLGGPDSGLVALPNTPPVNTFLEFATILATCKIGEASGVNPRDVKAYVVFPDQMGPAGRADLDGLSYADALQRGNYSDIHYVFGVYELKDGKPLHSSYPGEIKPVCGELLLKVTDLDDVNSPGSKYILEQYHRMIIIMWQDVAGSGEWGDGSSATMNLHTMGHGFVKRNFPQDIRENITDSPRGQDSNYPEATAVDLSAANAYYTLEVERIIKEAVRLQLTSPAWTQMVQYGWAGAGIWYNNIARLNGSLISAAYSLPSIRKYPEVMEYVSQQRVAQKEAGVGSERFNPELANGRAINFDPEKDGMMAQVLYKAMISWQGSYSKTSLSGNPFIDTINALFGTQGLFDLQKNTDTHPLAALVAMGKGLVDSSISNLGAAGAAGLAGGVINFFKDLAPLGTTAINASKFAMSIGMMAMTIGILLFYVLPFIPFLYFFFAVGGWVKGIFESIVAVPLWALAHIRIDHSGGMPGDAARGGYFMLFEIFLRPLLIVFGLLAAITIFSAQVRILNEIWSLVVSNVTGYDATAGKAIAKGETGSLSYFRGIADRFFFTVMYAIVVYMMGMASFKLIDILPNQILRWLGAEGGAFSDQVGNGPDGMMTKMSVGTERITSQLGDLGKQGLSAIDKNQRQLGGEIS